MFRGSAGALLIAGVLLAQPAKRPPRPRQASAPASARAKNVVDPSKPFPLESIRITGNQQFSDAGIVRMTGLHPGQSVRKDDFDAAQQKLLASGLFETVAYRYQPLPGGQSYSATFEVKEIGPLMGYRFEAVDLPEKDLRAWLKKEEPMFGDRIPATQPVLKRFQDALDKFATSRNKPAGIVGKVMPDAKGQLEVVFQPSSLPAIAQVHFTGNKALSAQALQQGISGAAIGALYTENRFRQILDASVRPLYEAQGYLRVSFPAIETTAAADVRGVVASVTVVEGDVYKLREVKLGGEMAGNQRLLKEGVFRAGEVVDMKAVEEGAGRIERSLKRRGFLNAAAAIERKVDDKARLVDVLIAIDPGQQYRMGKLDIIGLDITTEPHVRKMWALKEKAPFDFEYPDIFLKQMPEVLDNLGRTRSTIKPDPGTLTVDVLLTMNPPEKKPEDKQKRPGEGGPNRTPVDFPF